MHDFPSPVLDPPHMIAKMKGLLVAMVMMEALLGGAWIQSRRLAGAHCSHTPSYLVNGAQTSREGEGRLLGAGLPLCRLVWACRLLVSHRQVGPAACGPYRQAVVGTGLRLSGTTSRGKWQYCRVVRRSPPVRGTVAMPSPGFGGEGLHCSLTLSCPLDEGRRL